MMTQIKSAQEGFSLVEMAIVIAILGLVLAALLLPLRVQRESAAYLETLSTLDRAKQALLGFAQTNGRLPCPASVASVGQESPIGGTHVLILPGVKQCTVMSGFLPAVTLGIQPVNQQGLIVDAWNNPIHYAVEQSDNSAVKLPAGATTVCGGDVASDFTTAGNMAAVGLNCLTPNLRVCAKSAGVTAAKCSNTAPESNYLINNAVAVIFSTGPTVRQGMVGRPDETENLNAVGANQTDTVFVSHEISLAAPPNEFDHLVTWISPYVLYNAMIQAGQLH
jgi:prepilin-type N-terminal cleavage/methylation domain-containing protein